MTDDLFMIAFAIALASVPYLLVRLLSSFFNHQWEPPHVSHWLFVCRHIPCVGCLAHCRTPTRV